MTRVAYLVGRYPAVSHTFILREVTALRERGVTVEPISINRAQPHDTLSQADRDEAARTYSILPPDWRRLLGVHLRALGTRPVSYLRAAREAARLARPGLRGALWEAFYFVEGIMVWEHCHRRGLRHIHVHHLNQAADAAMIAIAYAGSGLTWTYTMHGPDEFSDVTGFRLPEKARSAAAIACISEFARSQVMAVLDPAEWDKLRVVHCGLVPEDFQRPNGGPPVGEPGRAHVLYVGRMVPVKGQTLLLEAISRLVGEGLDVTATFIGEGPQRAVVERRAAELGLGSRVEVLGAVGQDEIRRHFAAADLFVLPSFAEGVPVVLMEAMSMRVPVITTRIAGIPELVEDGESGLLVAPGSADELADAIGALARDPQRRRQMGANGRQKVAREFDVRDAAAQLESMFAEVGA